MQSRAAMSAALNTCSLRTPQERTSPGSGCDCSSSSSSKDSTAASHILVPGQLAMHPALEPDPFVAFLDPTVADDIYVDKDWRPKVGQPVPQCDGIYVGKKFGAGALSMNSIYDLVDQDNNGVGEALKVCKPTRAARRSLAHEWKIFKDLALLGEQHPAARSHFLQAHRVLKLHDDSMVGIIMEKANGNNVVKTLKDPGFCNVRYVIALLRDLLVALDVAQRVLGFAHYDLKLDNVLEHWLCCPDPAMAKRRALLDAVPQFKLFDFGTSVIYPDPFSVKVVADPEHLAGPVVQRPEAAQQLAQEARYGNSDKPGVVTHSAREPQFEFSEPFFCVRIYHMYWQRKGDVYRVLHALCRLLDSRTWPVEDLELVSLLFTVLEHTTNSRRLKAHFVPKAALARQLGLADDAGGKSQPKQQEKEMERQQQQQPRAIAAAAPAGPPGGAATPTHPAGAAAAPPITARQPQQQQQNGGPGHSVANIKVGQDSHSLTNVSPTDGAAAAAAATARRTSAELHRTRSKPLVPGVAYVRLSPPPSPRPPGLTAEQEIAAEAAANAALPPGDMPTDQIRESCCDSMRLAGTPAVSSPAAGAEQQHMAAASATRARSAAMLEEGCRVDPAAAVVASEPLAPPAAQSVFGSRKALKGVTAQELLAEPVVQSLLKRLE